VSKGESFDTLAEARAWAVDTERRIKAGLGVSVSGRTFGELLERYAADVSPRKPSGEWEQTRILHFCRDPIARVKLDELGAPQIAAWRDRRLKEVSGGTIRRDMALLSHACRIAVREWRWMLHNPVSDVTRPKENESRDRLATSDEIERLVHVGGEDMETVQGRAVAAFLFAIETGMRGSEICALRRADVHADYVRVMRSKNGTRRDVALSGEARRILETVMSLDADPVWVLTNAQKDAMFRRVCRRAGIVDLHFHDSRHTAITRLSQKIDVLALARMVGTKDLATLMIYYNPSASDIARRL
jgi:integrase